MKNNNNKGVTLLALIITVIVMLLLVGVAIYGINNFGLLNKAGQVKSMYDNSYNEEEIGSVTDALHKSITGPTGGSTAIGDITITPSTTSWAPSVIITIETTTQVDGYSIYYKTNDILSWTKYTGPITISKNERVQACLQKDSEQGNPVYYDVTNIDTLAPVIESATGSTDTRSDGVITVTGITDPKDSTGTSGTSGIKGYYVAQSTVKTPPDATSNQWISLNGADNFTYPATNGTYIVWVIDNAGNITQIGTQTKPITVSNVVGNAVITAYNDLTIVAGNKATPTLKYSGVANTITYSSNNTGISTINSSTGEVTGISAGTATMTVTMTNYDNTVVTATCTVTVQTAVARTDLPTGSIYYASLQAAINAVPTTNVQTTVLLLTNTTESITISSNNNVNLNLNSKTINYSNATNNAICVNINGGGTCTITNGTISANSSGGYVNGISNIGTCTITNVTISANSSTDNATGIVNVGTCTITNATISAHVSDVGVCFGIQNDGSCTITGGSISATHGNSFQYDVWNVGTTLITDCSITTGYLCTYGNSASTIKITTTPGTGYKIECYVEKNVTDAQFPTWWTADQTNTIYWYQATKQTSQIADSTNDCWVCTVNIANHQYHTGLYTTHIYNTIQNGTSTFITGFNVNI